MQDTIACFELPPRYSPAEDDDLLDFLRQHPAEPVRIDAAALQSFDGLMLELLLTARHSRASTGQPMELANIPDPVREELRLLGAEELLGTEGRGE